MAQERRRTDGDAMSAQHPKRTTPTTPGVTPAGGERLSDALQTALDLASTGDVHAAAPGGATAHVLLDDMDRLGAEVREIRVRSEVARDIAREASTLPGRLDRLLPEPVIPIEVALPGSGLAEGQAVLRTPPDRMHDRRYFDLEVWQTGDAVLRRYRVNASGEREPKTWMMTREQLGHLVDELT